MVSVRSRNWMVTEVSASTLPPERLQTGLESPQHLLTLSSVEDDGLGEELNVIWELEPGARVVEKVALPEPTGFDPPDRLDAFLDAVRWGASSSADVRNIQAPFRAGIDIEDYQLDPVVRAIQMPRVNLLVADDVGLGKTIEAGMVALELIVVPHDYHAASARGVTKTYNCFHNPDETSADIQKLRQLHVEMDKAVVAAYGLD